MYKTFVAFTTIQMIDASASRARLDREEWVMVYKGVAGESRESVFQHANEQIKFLTWDYPYLRVDLMTNLKVITATMASVATPFRNYYANVFDRTWVRRAADRAHSTRQV